MYGLIIVTGPCLSVAVCINPLQTLLIRTYITYLHHSKPFTCHSVLNRVILVFNRGVPYKTVIKGIAHVTKMLLSFLILGRYAKTRSHAVVHNYRTTDISSFEVV